MHGPAWVTVNFTKSRIETRVTIPFSKSLYISATLNIASLQYAICNNIAYTASLSPFASSITPANYCSLQSRIIFYDSWHMQIMVCYRLLCKSLRILQFSYMPPQVHIPFHSYMVKDYMWS